jgi:hypothetical protein
MHSTKDTTSNMPHCGESHPASHKGCKVYQEIIRTRFSSPEQQQVFLLQKQRDKKKKALKHHRKLKDNWTYAKRPEILLKRQQSQQTTHKNTH